MIYVKDVTKRYGEKIVLNGVNLEVREGEIVLMEGESGAGKTTLLNLIAGIDIPDSGSIIVDGINIVELSEDMRARWRLEKIGIIFQNYGLIDELTVEENISLPLKLAGKKWKERVFELMDFLDIIPLRSKKINTLSGGEMQRVCIARALANSPKIILADEPTSNLDDRNVDKVIEIFRKIRDNYKATIVIASHDSRISSIVDKRYMLKDGRIISNG